ncbi:MAG: TIGR04211 family SH3 domain-containing protein [Proteobacteria bacterium]|nr:TIGR04211 family SH3 domain-containing protein [Pseudomonadota bacterium]
MKRFFLIGIGLILLAYPVMAQDIYVTDSLKATFRTGPGNDHKILRMISSGERMTVLEAQENWTKVQLPSGTEGWMLNQWLTEDVPKGIQLEALQKKYESLLSKHSALKQEFELMETENKSLKVNLAISNKKERDIRNEYDELKAGSGQYLELKADYTKIKTSFEEKTRECDKLNDQLTQKQIFWTLTGAGILLTGIIIGFSSKRKRRHSLLD